MENITKLIKTCYTIPFIRRMGRYYLNTNQVLWNHLPAKYQRFEIVRSYGCFLHSIVCVNADRKQSLKSYFLRNRAELDFIYCIATKFKSGSNLKTTVLGCSTGMEPYSINWRLKDLWSNLNICINGVYISSESLEIAQRGEYPLNDFKQHLSRLTEKESACIIRYEDGIAKIRTNLKDHIQWHLGDVCHQNILESLSKQDIVLANRFLCHMAPKQAEVCLSNISNLVADNGYLFVSGVDLDIRKKVLKKMAFIPLTDHLVDIHNGDPTLLAGWPSKYWGLEPLPRSNKKISSRYATVWKKCSK